jgi:hypothetical protein
MARYHGRTGIVYGSTTAAGVASQIASLSAWTLDMSTDKTDATAFGDLNKVQFIGLKNLQGTLSGFWDNAEDKLFAGADSQDGVKLYLYPASTAPTVYWYGPAWLDASINVSNTGMVTLSANFVASGSWGRKP